MPFIKIEDNNVKQQVNKIPENSTDEWREVVIIRPEINFDKQKYGNFIYDLTKTPAEMVYPVIELTEEERKIKLLFNNKRNYKQIIESELNKEFGFNNDGEAINCNISFIEENILNYRNKKTQIEQCKTHEEIDSIVL